MSSSHRSVIIIGSGPAGYTAAIYAARANLKPLVFEGLQPGGQLTITTDVENFPGFPEGILGPDLMDNLKKQAARFGTEIISTYVTEVDFSKKPYTIKTDNETYTANAVIISTGASARLLGLEAESKLMGRGVSACATCDGFFFKDKEVLVVGGGDTAMEEAHFLTRFCKKVTIVHRRDELRASKIMQDRAKANPKVDFIWNAEITEMHGDFTSGLTGVTLKDTQTQETRELATEGVFVAIGHKPNTDLFTGQIDLHDNGYIKVAAGTVNTNKEGVFACGDVMDHHYRQAITAAGTGCMAAMDAEKYLEAKETELAAV